MKAARWVGPGRVVCEDVPVPPVADGEILIRTAYASICGSDLHSVFFSTPPQPGAPVHPGHESVGEVVESPCPGFEPARVLVPDKSPARLAYSRACVPDRPRAHRQRAEGVDQVLTGGRSWR